MRCKDQLDPDEEDEMRQIASVHFHVERAIKRIKNFNILRQIIPNTMAEDINKIWKVCAILTDFRGPGFLAMVLQDKNRNKVGHNRMYYMGVYIL